MKNNKKILLIATGIVFAIIILISSIFLYKEHSQKKVPMEEIDSSLNLDETSEKLNINIYYLDSINNKLIFENKEIENTTDQVFNDVFNFMKEPSKATNGTASVVPENLSMLSFELEDNETLKVDFSKEYKNMKEPEEIFFRSAFVWTMTELPNVSNIEISVDGELITKGDGEPMGLLNRQNIVLNPTISPEKVEHEQVTLYFSDAEELSLVPEKRLVEVKQSQSLETQIVEQLILGPEEEGHFSTIPTDTKIRNIKTEGGICYVDLSSEFVSKHSGGSSAEIFTIYSIVNSLTELEEVNKVQFLIEGEKVGVYKGSLDISKPLDRKEI